MDLSCSRRNVTALRRATVGEDTRRCLAECSLVKRDIFWAAALLFKWESSDTHCPRKKSLWASHRVVLSWKNSVRAWESFSLVSSWFRRDLFSHHWQVLGKAFEREKSRDNGAWSDQVIEPSSDDTTLFKIGPETKKKSSPGKHLIWRRVEWELFTGRVFDSPRIKQVMGADPFPKRSG